MSTHTWLQIAHELHSRQTPFALVSVLRVTAPTSAKAGDKAVVTADGQIQGWIGGGCAQPAVIKTVRAALADGQARSIRISPAQESHEQQLADVLEFGMACHSGGTLELFIDPVLPQASLTVLGDSPVARALCDLAPRVGFAVHLVAQGAQAQDHPTASRVLASDEAAQVAAALGTGGWVVVATQGRRDLQALKAALALKARRTWFVASGRKGAVLKQSLIASGEDAARVEAIVAPAGAAIGPQTPEEIALAVLAAVVAARRSEVNDALASPAPVSAPVSTPETAPVRIAAASSCCGGRAAGAAPVKAEVKAEASAPKEMSAVAEVAAPVAKAAPSSCCGG
ncbi:MAG: XdhC family protein [Betaproteobacteria bacterium]